MLASDKIWFEKEVEFTVKLLCDLVCHLPDIVFNQSIKKKLVIPLKISLQLNF